MEDCLKLAPAVDSAIVSVTELKTMVSRHSPLVLEGVERGIAALDSLGLIEYI